MMRLSPSTVSSIVGTISCFLVMFCLNVPESTAQSSDTNASLTNSDADRLSYQELYEVLKKSTVQIDIFDSVLGPLGTGSGFMYDDQGHVVTNHHVALPPQVGEISYDIIFLDGGRYPASYVGSDPFTDLAVLKIENASTDKIIPLTLAEF